MIFKTGVLAKVAGSSVAQRITITFDDCDSGIAELTRGQLSHWWNVGLSGITESAGGMTKLAAGTTVDDIVRLLRYVMNRHQALRTRIFADENGHPWQEILASGQIDLEIIDADDAADPEALADAVRVVYEYAKWDFAGELPVRMAVIRHRGEASHFIAMYSNICIDGYGIDALVTDLANMDPVTGEPLAPVTGLVPLEISRREHSPAGERQKKASLRHLERILRAVEPRRFDESPDKRSPRYWECSLRSPAMHMALRVLSSRLGVHSGTVMLAAYAVALARISGRHRSLVRTMVSNRFRPGFETSVSCVSQAGLSVIDVADCTFDEVVSRAFKAQLATGMNAYFDPYDLARLLDELSAERGEEYDMWVAYNDRRRGLAMAGSSGPLPTEEQVRAALSRSEFSWNKPWDAFDTTVYLTLDGTPDTLECLMHADTHAVPPGMLESACRGLETMIVEAAFNPVVTTDVTAHPAVPR